MNPATAPIVRCANSAVPAPIVLTNNTTPREEALRIEVTIGAPVDVVWQALREPDQVRRWHGWHFDGLDDEIKLIYETGAHETDRPYVLVVEPDDLFELEEVDGGTLVRIIRSKPDPNSAWAAYYDDVTEGWISFLNQLRFMLERHPERRTANRVLLCSRHRFDARGADRRQPSRERPAVVRRGQSARCRRRRSGARAAHRRHHLDRWRHGDPDDLRPGRHHLRAHPRAMVCLVAQAPLRRTGPCLVTSEALRRC
jgi:hypothetical protein